MAEACALLLGLAVERERFLLLARAAEETRTSEQMKSTLLAQLAHDLKTPVAAARGAIENWEADSGGSEASRLAGGQLDALNRRIGELMDVVRLDSGAARPRPARVTCAEIVEAAVARFGEALAGHSLYLDPPAPDLAVEVDPAQLTEALGHGLENAARYSPAGSTIRVSAAAEGAQAILRVADQGKGVPERERERVFERFVRLDENREIPGSGLGLSIARSLVELNGGRLRLGQRPGRRHALRDRAAAGERVSRVLARRRRGGDPQGRPRRARARGPRGRRGGRRTGGARRVRGRRVRPRRHATSRCRAWTAIALVAEVRRRSAVPILVLTVRDEEREKVRLLDAGRGRLRDEALRRRGARRARARPAAPDAAHPGAPRSPAGATSRSIRRPGRSARAASPCT